jgi:hypothetical protein
MNDDPGGCNPIGCLMWLIFWGAIIWVATQVLGFVV